jgi:hypothetical protein
MTLEALAKRLDAIGADVTSMRSDIKSIDGKVASLDGKVDSLDHKMKIEFEATRSVIKLGFENVQILDEKIDRRFDTTDRVNADNKSLLEAALVRLRHDVERPSRARTRR